MKHAGSWSRTETALSNPSSPLHALFPAGLRAHDAAMIWFRFGFDVIPVVPGTKRPAVPWDPWLIQLSPESIDRHWSQWPNHEVGFIVGGRYVIFDADSVVAAAALEAIEVRFGLTSRLVIKTPHGLHHYFGLADGTFATSSAHCTAKHPTRLDVKTGRTMVVLPPGGGRSIVATDGRGSLVHARQLSTVDQAVIDAVFAHNGQPPPRRLAPVASTRAAPADAPLPLLSAVLQALDPDLGYDEWLRVGAALFHVTGASDEGFALFDRWSSAGCKYRGPRETAAKWRWRIQPVSATHWLNISAGVW